MDLVFIGAMALFYLLTVALAAGCDKLGQIGGQP
ncbi:potassium ABC transporter ATPase [Duganella lactea]